MRLHNVPFAGFLLLLPVLSGQNNGAAPEDLLKPLKESWPTYNGDYSGKRFSALDQINQTNVKDLTLAWMTRVTAGPGSPGGGFPGGRFRGGAPATVIVGGEGPEIGRASCRERV